MLLYHISHKAKEGLWTPMARDPQFELNREPSIPCICTAPTLAECFNAVWMLDFKPQVAEYEYSVFEANVEKAVTPQELSGYVHDLQFTREHRILVPTQMTRKGSVIFTLDHFVEFDGLHYGTQKLPIFTQRRIK